MLNNRHPFINPILKLSIETAKKIGFLGEELGGKE